MIVKIKNLLTDNSGQGLAEYSLILSFVVVTVIVALYALGQKILDEFYNYTMEKWPGF